MLNCEGCPVAPPEQVMAPSLAGEGSYRVALVGDMLGKDDGGMPFGGKAGFNLTRLIEWAGFDRSRFDIWNTIWCVPPQDCRDRLEPVYHSCRERYWERLLDRVDVVVPMGNIAMQAFTGKKGVLDLRGYVTRGLGTTHVIPTVHPAFIRAGQSRYSAAFIHDLQKAVQLAREGLPIQPTNYMIDPLPVQALEWAKSYLRALDADPNLKLAYDIETPYKDEDESDSDDEEVTTDYTIWRIGFSYAGLSALTVPWTPPYFPVIKMILESHGLKVVWNAGFDNPRIRSKGIAINGTIHDGMIAWHILHSDLPKGLGFVATFTCPWQHEWKSLSGKAPGLYNCIDADVEWRSMEVIETELKRTGLWDVYIEDVVELDPILLYMTEQGMPVDSHVRLDRAVKLDDRLQEVKHEIEKLVPTETRTYKPKAGYVKPPGEIDASFISIDVDVEVSRCSECGVAGPTAPHFTKRTLAIAGTPGRKKTDRRSNPCFGAKKVSAVETVQRYAKLDSFTPSRNQLIRYQQHFGRFIPMTWDKKAKRRKISLNAKGMKELIRRYPDDPIYPLVLEHRELDKLAGTYIGRPVYDD